MSNIEEVEFETALGTEVTLTIEQDDTDQTQAVTTADVDCDDVPEQEVHLLEGTFSDHDESYEFVMQTNDDFEGRLATVPLSDETHDKIESAIDVVTKEHGKTVEQALEEAKETGEPVQVGQRRTTYCNDVQKECNIDHVRTMAYPSGEVKEERIHTF